jgi:hypothetical protein
MVKSARERRTSQRAHAAGPVLPEDLVLWEIVYRLSSKELLRCGAVCRLWRRLDLYYVLAVGSSSLEEERCVGPLELPSTFVTLDYENPLCWN